MALSTPLAVPQRRGKSDERVTQAAEELWSHLNGDQGRSLSGAPGPRASIRVDRRGCYELIMDEVGLDFRATKDLDIVLVIEALDSAFTERFWAFVEEGGYESGARRERRFCTLPEPKASFPVLKAVLARA